MTTIRNRCMIAMAAALILVSVSACQKKEGPAERAGKEIDNSIQRAGQQMEKAGRQIEDASKR